MNGEIVVNLHVTERCNYNCSFCFGQWGLRSYREAEVFADLAAARQLIEDVFGAIVSGSLGPARRVRFNFVGGEPGLLRPLPELVYFSRSLGARTSYVSNGL